MSRTVRHGLAAGALAIVSLLAFGAPAAADDDDPRPGEGGADIATPGFEANSQLVAQRNALPQAATVAVTAAIDDFVYDDLLTVGTAAEVCYGSLRPGTAATYQELVTRFGGTPGTLYSCRERYAVHERRECDGQVANRTTNPNFFSDCWSNHAQGRALDIMVGTSGGGYNKARGNGIVDFLLAPDAAGNQNANARRLGVQQILWNDRCWNSDGDRGIASAAEMRPCGYGHFDHVHVDMTLDGADGRTSWWGYTPRRSPKLNSIWTHAPGGAWEWRTLVNLGVVAARTGSYPPRFATQVRGDWNGDGVSNEIFVWAPQSGEYQVRDGTTGSTLRQGTASSIVDTFVNGDFDGDGRSNDMILMDTETGYATLWTWTTGGPYGRSQWSWGGGWDELVSFDGNSEGFVNETYLFDQESRVWYVHTFGGGSPYYLNSGTDERVWDDVAAGDLDAQGNLDDLFLRDRETGEWAVHNYTGHAVLAQQTSGTWLLDWDDFVMGDWDTDGRVDEMFVHDRDSGNWTMVSWHRYGYRQVMASAYVAGLDNLLSGTFG